MKIKLINLILPCFGLFLLILATVLTVITVNNMADNGVGIIGGAGLPTFRFVFFGKYGFLSNTGIGLLLIQLFITIIQKFKGHK